MHIPVLLKEVLDIFDPQPGQTYIDATANGGGHLRVIAENIKPGGTAIGIDWDCALIDALKIKSREWSIPNVALVCANYKDIKKIVKERSASHVNGILFDLGFSSHHIDQSGRGFSFQRDEPLDMRYNVNEEDRTAEKIINRDPREALERVIRAYGDERYAGRIASGIVAARMRRRIRTTHDLAEIISRAVPAAYQRGRIHPATRTFQALRIAVNHELENLEIALRDSLPILSAGGILIVISFHSLEDRIAKNFFREELNQRTVEIITKKPVRAHQEEIVKNTRARSAILRAARKL